MPGLYVVGELGGRGLIKNAINEGKIAVEHAALMLRERPAPGAPDPERHDLLVVGSDPAGVSAALEAARARLHYRVLEQGNLSGSIARYPRRGIHARRRGASPTGSEFRNRGGGGRRQPAAVTGPRGGKGASNEEPLGWVFQESGRIRAPRGTRPRKECMPDQRRSARL